MPAIHCCSVTAAHREARSLVLLYCWGMVGVKLPARNKGISGTLPWPTMLRQLPVVKTCIFIACMCTYIVYTCTYCSTLYMGTTHCMHIPILFLPLHTSLYSLSLWHSYIYRNQPLSTYRDISPIYPREWWLRQLIIPWKYIAYTCIYSVYTCTYTVHGYYIIVHIVCIYQYCFCHCILACTAFDIDIYTGIFHCVHTGLYLQYSIYPLRIVIKTTDNTMHIHCMCVHRVYIHVYTV
jgi:hypothetical protein